MRTPSLLSGITALISVCTILIGIAFTRDGQQALPGKVVGLNSEALSVSNLERSIDFYKMIGFSVVGTANPRKLENEGENRLYNTPGAVSRTATLTIAATGSGKPFTLYLREYNNIGRGARVDFPARDPSSCHLGVLVPEADALWERMKTAGLLRALSWDSKLVRMPGQNSGGIAYVMDPDGFNIEIIGVRTPSAPSAQKSPDLPTLHHLGISVLNSGKSMAFYGGLLGGKFPETLPKWVSGDNYDAAVGGHGYVIRLINGTFPETAASLSEMRFELVEYQKPNRQEIPDYRVSDVAVGCARFQVEGLDALCARLKSAGIPVWSKAGIVQKKDGTRAAVVRDPDVGAFVELFEKPGR